MSNAKSLVNEWRLMGPVAWAEGPYGWTGEDGKPITLEPWQRAVLSAWWERREDVTTLAVSNVKKTGKTFVNAVLLAWRWLALPGEHFAAGNDLDQSAGRQFQMVAEMVKRNPYLSRSCRVEKLRLAFEPMGSTIVALSVDAAGNAGANHLTASHTEAWGIQYEAGVRAYEELTPPPGRRYGFLALRIADSYAGFEGESQTWHDLVDRGLAGDRVSDDWPIFQSGGLLLFHMGGEEARRRCFRGTPEEAANYYAEQKRDLRANTFTRMHDNKRTANESAFILPEQWAACFSPDVRRWTEGDTRRLTLGADASTSRDLTALVGVSWNESAKQTEAIYCRVWRPERGEYRGGKPTIDLQATIGDEVLRLHGLGVVDSVIFDPFQLHSIALAWEKAGIRVIELPQTNARIESDQSLYDAILSKSLVHCGDPELTEHITNAVAVETPRGFRLAKERTSRKIDAAVALSMAHHGAMGDVAGMSPLVARTIGDLEEEEERPRGHLILERDDSGGLWVRETREPMCTIKCVAPMSAPFPVIIGGRPCFPSPDQEFSAPLEEGRRLVRKYGAGCFQILDQREVSGVESLAL